MDGQLFLKYLDQILKQEKIKAETDITVDETSFHFGDIAAVQFAQDTLLLRRQGEITTVADTRVYDLPPDFIKLARKDPTDLRQEVIQYLESGSTDPVLIRRKPIDLFYGYDSEEYQDIPDFFDIIEEEIELTENPKEVTGTTSAAGSESNGESTLTDATATFNSGDDRVYPRHRVYNTTNGYAGMILEVTNATSLKTVLWEEDAYRGWGNGDAYKIQKTSNFRLIFDNGTDTAGDTIKFDYYCTPKPVFTKYGVFGFPDPMHVFALAVYAAWLYKFRHQLKNVHGVNTAAFKADKLYLMYNHYVDKCLARRNKQKRSHARDPFWEVM
jgi:hypothetical protein